MFPFRLDLLNIFDFDFNKNNSNCLRIDHENHLNLNFSNKFANLFAENSLQFSNGLALIYRNRIN